jgi:4-hydroxy-tetrahydrodipicolinate synthase
MNNGKVDWRGNFPAVVTPFTSEGDIDEGKFVENIEILMSEGADGIVISGSNGESWALRGEERLRLFRLGVEAAKGRITVIGGTGSIITDDVVALTQAARETGLDGVMIMPPYYCKATRRDVVAHYRAVSDGAAFPILVYNSPGATGVNVTADFCAELAEIEWIVAIKQSTTDFVEFQETADRCSDRLLVFTGHSAVRGLGAMIAGAAGFVSSLDPHVMGAEAIALYRLAKDGPVEEARRVQMRTMRLARALGPIGSGPAVMKAAMNLLGRPGGYPRRPLLALTQAETDKVAAVLDELGLTAGTRKAAE